MLIATVWDAPIIYCLFAPDECKLRGMNDYTDILNANEIGRAYWTYKEMDFGIVNSAGEIAHPEIIEIIRRR
jgi:endoglucanase